MSGEKKQCEEYKIKDVNFGVKSVRNKRCEELKM